MRIAVDRLTALVAATFTGGGCAPEEARGIADGLVPGGPRGAAGDLGAIRAMGDHKGSGLALMCELLAGALTGSGTSGPGLRRFCNGMLSIYMAPETFGSADGIGAETRSFVRSVPASRTAAPGGELLLPGDPERATRADRMDNGIPLTDDIWRPITHTALAAGIDPASPLLAV